MAGKKPLSPAEWGKHNPEKTPGSKCYVCSRPDLVAIVEECVGKLGWTSARTCAYIREEHGYPRQRNSLLVHVREHRK